MVKFPRIIGHRGAPHAAPENTLASFRQAAKEGARWVEFDAVLTADGRPVVFHDDSLERTTDGAGLLGDTTFDVLRGLDAGMWFSRDFVGELVPTLEEVLDLLGELGLGFNMEIKPTAGKEVETAHVVLAATAGAWPPDAPQPLISSFSRSAVAVAKEVAAAWPRGLLFDRQPEDWRAVGTQLGATTLGGNHRYLVADQIRDMRDAGYGVMAYTVNEAARAETLFAWGVNSIFTDTPGEMLRAFPES